jgi:hypothetical protein
MEGRLRAMIDAANEVRPALDDFYASLSDEQKARFQARPAAGKVGRVKRHFNGGLARLFGHLARRGQSPLACARISVLDTANMATGLPWWGSSPAFPPGRQPLAITMVFHERIAARRAMTSCD